MYLTESVAPRPLNVITSRAQIPCAVAALVSAPIQGAGLWLLAKWVPPPGGALSAEDIARTYTENTDGIRLGVMLIYLGLTFWAPFIAVITRQLLRIPPKYNVWALLQLICGTAGWVFLTIPHIVLSVAVFRPNRNPEITQTLHDLGWFLILVPVAPFVLQACVVALAILQDPTPGSVYPRWVAWFSLLMALLEAPGFMVTFFKSGIFAYDGLFTFWIPLVAFGAWLVGMAIVTISVVRKESQESLPPTADPAS